MKEKGLSRNQLIRELTKSPHGDLDSYNAIGSRAGSEDAEFFAHLIAWNHKHGQIRDSKVALPVVSVVNPDFDDEELVENSFAHMLLLDPRNFLRAARHAIGFQWPKAMVRTRGLVLRYLRAREEKRSWWERSALAHRKSMKELYALFHIKPFGLGQLVLFNRKHPKGSIFDAVAQLRNMSDAEAAGTILEHKIPFLTARGAMGKRIEAEALMMALIERMSPTELVTNAAMLERYGVKNHAATRVAFDAKLAEAAKSKRATLKTSKATRAVKDKTLKAKLDATQEKQLDAIAVEGNWLVLGDRSPSMKYAVPAAAEVASVLARVAKGNVWLIFFDSSVHKVIDATGLTHEQIRAQTRHVRDGGSGTSIAIGVEYARQHRWEVDGIAVVSDGEENRGVFALSYQSYCEEMDKEPTVYHYWMNGDLRSLGFFRDAVDVMGPNCAKAGVNVERFDLTKHSLDYYSLPNLVQTMRTNRFSLADEVMSVPLLTIEKALSPEMVGRI